MSTTNCDDSDSDSSPTTSFPDVLILVCVDDTEHSFRAFNWYSENFHRDEHIVGLLHIYSPHPQCCTAQSSCLNSDDSVDDSVSFSTSTEHLQQLEEESRRIIQKFQTLCKKRGMRSRVFVEEKHESIGKTICDIAKYNDAACVVLGPRGLKALERTIYGSVSDYVIRNLHVPVVFVPPPKYPVI